MFSNYNGKKNQKSIAEEKLKNPQIRGIKQNTRIQPIGQRGNHKGNQKIPQDK